MGNGHGKSEWEKTIKVLFEGPYGSGKSTIQHRLAHGEFKEERWPTIDSNAETVQIKGLAVQVWDVGGRDTIRVLHRFYYKHIHALIYVIDSQDKDGLDDAISELGLTLEEDDMKGRNVVILANKQDLDGALTAEEITKKMNVINRKRKRSLQIPVFPTSAKTGEGFTEVCEWLYAHLSNDSDDGKKSQKSEKGVMDRVLRKVKHILID